jgi:quinol monooxygenase YgiN
MLTITAVIRAKRGREEVVERALRAVIAEVKANEPGTGAYFVSRSKEDPTIFTTFERFVDEAAMALHNDSQAVANFVAATSDSLEGSMVLHACRELDAKLP